MLTPFFIGDGGKLATEFYLMAAEVKKPAEAGLKPKLLLLVSYRVGRCRLNSSRFHDESR